MATIRHNQISKFLEEEAHRVVTEVKQAAFDEAVDSTPVSGVLLKGNWQIKGQSPGRGITSQRGRVGTSTKQRAASHLKRAPFDEVTYFFNNLPYAQAQNIRHRILQKAVSAGTRLLKRLRSR